MMRLLSRSDHHAEALTRNAASSSLRHTSCKPSSGFDDAYARDHKTVFDGQRDLVAIDGHRLPRLERAYALALLRGAPKQLDCASYRQSGAAHPHCARECESRTKEGRTS